MESRVKPEISKGFRNFSPPVLSEILNFEVGRMVFFATEEVSVNILSIKTTIFIFIWFFHQDVIYPDGVCTYAGGYASCPWCAVSLPLTDGGYDADPQGTSWQFCDCETCSKQIFLNFQLR